MTCVTEPHIIITFPNTTTDKENISHLSSWIRTLYPYYSDIFAIHNAFGDFNYQSLLNGTLLYGQKYQPFDACHINSSLIPSPIYFIHDNMECDIYTKMRNVLAVSGSFMILVQEKVWFGPRLHSPTLLPLITVDSSFMNYINNDTLTSIQFNRLSNISFMIWDDLYWNTVTIFFICLFWFYTSGKDLQQIWRRIKSPHKSLLTKN